MRPRFFSLLLVLLCSAALAGPPPSHKQLRVFVFGDSLSDNGNLIVYHPEYMGSEMPPPYDPQRFSNGPIWVDHVGTVLKTTVAPEVDGGTNYAASAATISPDNYLTVWPDITGFAEVDRYLEDFGSADPAAIYVVWFGGNDIDPPAEYTEWAFTTLVDMLGRLHAAGARNFLIPNMTDIGEWPLLRDFFPPDYAAALSEMTLLWNERLLELEDLFPDATIRISNVYALKEFIDRFPDLFGFTNTTDPCYHRWTDETVCPNPENYWFWDPSHPTTRAHRVLASLFVLDLWRAGMLKPKDFRH